MPKLYGYPACPRSRMALVAASEKGIDCSVQAIASWDGLAIYRHTSTKKELDGQPPCESPKAYRLETGISKNSPA